MTQWNRDQDQAEMLKQMDDHLNQFGIDLNLDQMNAANVQTTVVDSRRGGGGCSIGCLVFLMILALGVSIAAVVGTSISADARQIAAPLFCNEGEELVTTQSQISDGSGSSSRTSITFFCEGDDQVRREVTGAYVVASIMVILVVPSIFVPLIIITALRNSRGKVKTFTAGTPVITYTTFNSGNMPPGNVDPAQFMAEFFKTGGGSNLKERLQELQDAYNAGLITQAEFEQKKQEILKEL